MANPRIKDFISEIKTQGLARTNRFTVDVSPPTSTAAGVNRRVLLLCDSAQLPGVSYATTQNRTYGEFKEVPYDRLFDTVSLTFFVDNNMFVKKIFDDWILFIQNPVNRSFRYYSEYVRPMTIQVQDLNDKTKYEVKLHEAYPKTMAAVSLNAESKDVMKLQVTFQYKYFEVSPIVQLPNDQMVSANMIDKYNGNFSGFQARFNKGLGEAGNFITGAVGQYAMRSFSQVTSRIPSIKF